MQISITDAPLQTFIFSLIFAILILVSIRSKKDDSLFGISITNELKGFAILAILFSHIGYFLSTNQQFLFPLSVLAGVGVNLFLFLSGYGLSLSFQKGNYGILGFYKRRLIKLFLPLWLVLATFLILDKLILNINYPVDLTIKNFLGFYPESKLFEGVNSPLWYFSLILFFYLIFPILYYKKAPILSAILMAVVSFLLLKYKLPVLEDVQNLYELHFLSFPLGVAASVIIPKFRKISLRWNLLLIPLVMLLMHFSINSGVGQDQDREQGISILTLFLILVIFIIKKFRIKILELFGIYSYDIFLIHWPILSRFDYLYKYLPASLATVIYLLLFLVLGYGLQRIVGIILDGKKQIQPQKNS